MPSAQELLGSTRGEILALLCGVPRTVQELAELLGLTRNAVRGHLAILERDAMVRHSVVRRGVGKPAHLFRATPEGRGILSRAYQPVLRAVAGVLAERMDAGALEAVLREAGRRLGLPHARPGSGVRAGAEAAAGVLRELGAVAKVEDGEQPGELTIRGECCPLADLVAERPEVCKLVEALVGQVAGVEVREWCRRGEAPGCRFRVLGEPSV